MSEKRTFLVLDYILSIVVFLVTIAYMGDYPFVVSAEFSDRFSCL